MYVYVIILWSKSWYLLKSLTTFFFNFVNTLLLDKQFKIYKCIVIELKAHYDMC